MRIGIIGTGGMGGGFALEATSHLDRLLGVMGGLGLGLDRPLKILQRS